MKVLVSEWSRKAAHNLDHKREEWESARSASDYAERALVEGLKIDMRLDHETMLLGSYKNLQDLRLKVVGDIGVLGNFLATMKATGTINGAWYPKPTYEVYRVRLARELAYKHLLATTLKEAMRTRRMLANDERSLPVGDLPTLSDIELLDLLASTFRREMKAIHGETWFASLSPDDQALIEYLKFHSRARRLEENGIGTMEKTNGTL